MNETAKNSLDSIQTINVNLEMWEMELTEFDKFKRWGYFTPNMRRLEKQTVEQIARLTAQRNAIIKQIGAVKHDKRREFLYKRFVEGKTIERIAGEMFYERGSVQHIQEKALQDFADLCQDAD